jgi:hypothetical protein
VNTTIIKSFVPVRRNSLRGFAEVQLPSGMIVADVAVHITEGRPWAAPPSKPMLDRNGIVMRDDKGKIKYAPIISFATKDLRDRFSREVINAMTIAHPGEIEP